MVAGRRLGLDFGTVRIGVATSDPHGILVSPGNYILNNQDFSQNFSKLISEISPIYIAIGIPKHLSGNESEMSNLASDFALKLKELIQCDIFGIDERLSSKSAAEKLRQVGKNSKDGKEFIDSLAAAAILETAMELEKSGGLGKWRL